MRRENQELKRKVELFSKAQHELPKVQGIYNESLRRDGGDKEVVCIIDYHEKERETHKQIASNQS